MQAGAVVEFVLHLVHLRGDLVAARHGDRLPAGLHRHPAGQPAAHQPGRHHGHFVQELLDALGTEQRAVQFPEIAAVSDYFSVFSRHSHSHSCCVLSSRVPLPSTQTWPRAHGRLRPTVASTPMSPV